MEKTKLHHFDRFLALLPQFVEEKKMKNKKEKRYYGPICRATVDQLILYPVQPSSKQTSFIRSPASRAR
jgi:hypothetical protein